ncbi:hypothetical protein [Orrella marina]|uniref:Uncharacterized protein n=1 Tax=Orrella marina TaxID=2163011 RepID=A0A2R4XH78_9BURK|nr:hypothetical protein [Orrella marina]AWB33069.1 hypothetical protein DBV39_04310 [Orrella marina]
MTTTTNFDQLQLAKRWGLSTATLERWRTNGTGPQKFDTKCHFSPIFAGRAVLNQHVSPVGFRFLYWQQFV